MIAAMVMTKINAGGLIYLVWLGCAVGFILIGPWPRPVTRFRRVVSAAVVAVVLAGSLMTTAKYAALADNPCDMWDGWWKSICEWMP